MEEADDKTWKVNDGIFMYQQQWATLEYQNLKLYVIAWSIHELISIEKCSTSN